MVIRVLAPEVVAKIAAGEVVERPASVVKELVENSLDGGSRQVTVEVRGGGVSLIRVTDNGSGIPAEELDLAFQRYTTSKISEIEDLDSISSLGFRGEALASIAAVAQVELAACAGAGAAGSYLRLENGVVVARGSRGHARGTTVTVQNLFHSVPARLKFLKSVATEGSHIAHVISQYALAFPEVRFTLTTDGKTVLRTPGSGKLTDSITQVYGLEIASNLLNLRSEEDYQGLAEAPSFGVSGMVGSPSIGRSNRRYLSFFVNRRWVSSRLLAWAVEEAYRGLLMQEKHPVAVINIALSPGEVDVNIHPAKSEVRFRNERLVFGAVQKAVRQVLVGSAPVGVAEAPARYGAASTPPPGIAARVTEHRAVAPAPQTPLSLLPTLRLLGQLAASYIVAEGPDGLYLIDQHAAHERILFENLKRQLLDAALEVQGLLEPVTIEVSPAQDLSLKSRCRELAESGFTVEPFGERTYLVRTVPALLRDKDWMAALKELLDSPVEADRNEWFEKIATTITCHSAIRAGQVLTDEEMRELVRQMEKTPLANTCLHGRPTMIRLPLGQLEREFGRR